MAELKDNLFNETGSPLCLEAPGALTSFEYHLKTGKDEIAEGSEPFSTDCSIQTLPSPENYIQAFSLTKY